MSNKLYHYTECGLDYIWLTNGFELHETPYGKGVSFVAIDMLHQAIAREIVTSPRPIRGKEVRFLRSLLDVSQADLARTLGVTRITVTRWEKKQDADVGGTADTAMRLLYTSSMDKGSVVQRTLEMLREREEQTNGKNVTRKRVPKKKVVLVTKGNAWEPAQAA